LSGSFSGSEIHFEASGDPLPTLAHPWEFVSSIALPVFIKGSPKLAPFTPERAVGFRPRDLLTVDCLVKRDPAL
jgi:hypothetical protein